MSASSTAIIWGTRRLSWAQVGDHVLAVVSRMKGMGFKAGERVAVCSELSPEYLIALLALWRLNICVCPLNPHWPSALVLSYLSGLGCTRLMTTRALKAQLKTPLRTLMLNEVVCFDARHDVPSAGEWAPSLQAEATIIATSGSSGTPKPAVHSWATHIYSAQGAATVMPLQASDRWLLSLPLYHVSGIAIVVRCWLAKAAMILPSGDLEETLRRQHPTHLSLVTTQLYRLLKTSSGTQALAGVRYILLGGGPVPLELINQAQQHHLNLFVTYGLTEMGSQVATGPAGGCVKVLPHRQLQIRDGEIMVCGDTLFAGYVESGRIQRPLTDDGWFRTGDLGELDAEGGLKVTGRRDNMFICGGENIQPEEIEAVLLQFKGMAAAVVVPRDDAEFGQRPVAFLSLANADVSAVRDHCLKFLPPFKVPRQFYAWPAALESANLKVSRRHLREFLPQAVEIA